MNQMYQCDGNINKRNNYLKITTIITATSIINPKKNVEVDMEGVETERIILAGEVAASMKYK